MNAPPNLRYPEELVHRYGAKAGVLMYVAEQLPDIPQMPMVVKAPDEHVDDFLGRLDAAEIGWPRLFRSSAVEELWGYEGELESGLCRIFLDSSRRFESADDEQLKGGWDAVKRQILTVESSPAELKKKGEGLELPDKICVIGVEQSPSKANGTYIKHPNQEGVYLISLASDDYLLTPETGFSRRIVSENEFEPMDLPGWGLEEIMSWHDRIASLELMDSSWAYQIEFGIDPSYLYQVRPFKPSAKADFTIEDPDTESNPFVIGITPEDGIDVRFYRAPLGKQIQKSRIERQTKNHSTVFFGRLRDAHRAKYIENRRANILIHAEGFLAHEDIGAMRSADVTVLYNIDFPLLFRELDPQRMLNIGDWLNIVSDGTNIKITQI